MDCADIRSGFVSGRVPDGPAVDAHLKWCPHCRELFAQGARLGRRLASAVLPAVEAGDLFSKVDQELASDVGLRARLRALPTRTRAGALSVLGLGLLASHLLLRRHEDFGDYTPVVYWGVAGLLGAALIFGSLRLVRGTSAPLHAAERDRVLAILLMVLPALIALLAPLGLPAETSVAPLTTEALWRSAGGCFSYGAAFVVPFLVLAWLFERRDRVPLSVVVSAGALAGVAANLLLHAHCASAHPGHLLLGHASIGAAWALGLSVLSGQLARAR